MRHALASAALALATLAGAPALAQMNPSAFDQAEPSETEIWTGAAQLPGGAELGFTLAITRGAEPTATIDIPSQGAIGIPIRVESIEGDSYVLRIPAPANAEIAGTINDEGDLAGVLRQAGMEFPFKLERSSVEEAGPRRPQTPRPPFPYETIDATFDNPEAEGVTLAGTLTLPDAGVFGDGPFPAVVFVTGSGPQDRDETIVGHKPFAVIADHLARRGVAAFRFDDRGVAESTGDFENADTEDFASDARAAVNFAAKHERIDPSRVGLIGHSEGGLVAPIAAIAEPNIAFIILLAGTGVDGGEILISQQEAATRGLGAPAPAVNAVVENMALMVDAIRAGDDESAIEALREVMSAQNPTGTPEQIDQIVGQQAGFFTSPWMKRFVDLDPAESLGRVSVPVLALFGELDVQVVPEVNVSPMREALAPAPTSDVTILVLDDHNHLFQRAETGMGSEYGVIEETVSPQTLEIITAWIAQRFGN